MKGTVVMEDVAKCLNTLSTAILAVTFIYLTTAFPWVTVGGVDLAMGFAIAMATSASQLPAN
jgi:hypothetical protein